MATKKKASNNPSTKPRNRGGKKTEKRNDATGITLLGRKVSEKKPNEDTKRRIYELEKGRGYPVDELAKIWLVSPNCVKENASRFNCLFYIEVGPGKWVRCVLHPDTAEKYRKNKEIL